MDIKCDGIIVDYLYNGKWKHQEIILNQEGDIPTSEIDNDTVVAGIIATDRHHELSRDNIACFFRIHNWNKELSELEKFNKGTGNIKDLTGLVTALVIVNDSLYKEWLKPEKVM